MHYAKMVDLDRNQLRQHQKLCIMGIFFFFLGQGTGSATQRVPQHQPWELSGSLELSLHNAGGIWFKTPLSVGDANTAPLTSTHEGEMVSRHPKVID